MPAISAFAAASTYSDPAGDAQGGPDVTKVVIDGVPATRTITFAVTVPGYLPSSPRGVEQYVDVWLDTDRNDRTGDPEDGTEYDLSAGNDSTGAWMAAARWNGRKWEPLPDSPTRTFTRNGDVLSWTINTRDLGGASSFDFYILAGTWDTAAERDIAQDYAPNGDYWWAYDLFAVKPVIGKPIAVAPQRPVSPSPSSSRSHGVTTGSRF